jgi:hypothetical protein
LIVSASEMIRGADAIVRVLAREYMTPRTDASTMTTGVPESRIRFSVLEVIRASQPNGAAEFRRRAAPLRR